LLGGATLFGIGWGLSGFCPGPAVAALATGLTPVFAFVAAMLVGMALYRWIFERSDRGGVEAAPISRTPALRQARPRRSTSWTPGPGEGTRPG
jgi:uncharacterized membrane protein YedE/YeeE